MSMILDVIQNSVFYFFKVFCDCRLLELNNEHHPILRASENSFRSASSVLLDTLCSPVRRVFRGVIRKDNGKVVKEDER